MPAERRAALAEAAAEAGLWLVEDDPYSALRLDGERVDLLAAQPAARDRTIVIQTLSKVLSPGLRIGYLRAPAALRGPLAVAKQAADLHTSTVAQLAAERWLATHDLGEHIAGLGAHYRPRRDALLAALSEHLPAGSRWTRPRAGCSSGSSCPRATTPRRCCRARSSAASRSCPAGTSTRASRGARRCGSRSPPPRRPSCAEGAARLGAAIAG